MLPATVALSAVQRDALQRFAFELAARFPHDVLEVRLFGSRARGDAGPGSDVDVLVVVRETVPDDVRKAVGQVPKEVWPDDFPLLVPLILSEYDFRRHQAMRSLFYRDVRDQGIPLWRNSVDLWNEEGTPVVGRERDIRFHLDQAERALKSAQRDLAAEEAGGAASRAYYAAFHAASAALLTENIERAKHGNLIGEFNRLCSQNRLLGKPFAGNLDGLYKLRQDADYGKTHVKEKDARQALETAESIVEAAQSFCQRWLDRQGPDRKDTNL